MIEFCRHIGDRARSRLQREGRSDLVADDQWRGFDPMHKIRTAIGNMEVVVTDLKESCPPNIDAAKMTFWNLQWREEKAKSKRMKFFDAVSLPKKVRVSQDTASKVAGVPNTTGSGALVRTFRNAQCTVTVGVPHEALVFGEKIGSGAFGTCKKVTMQGISFFPEHMTFCAKCYKGDSNAQFDSFGAEAGMQKLHPNIVRCIAYTTESPWISIFPFFNGGTLGDLMMLLPWNYGKFRRTIYRLKHGFHFNNPPSTPLVSDVDLARLKAVVDNILPIMHAVIDGMAAAHSAGVLHTDLHAFNIVLDFTRDMHVRVGIIDWGLLLRAGKTRASMFYVFEPENHKEVVVERRVQGQKELRDKPWLAPELCDPLQNSAYSKESDVYALGWLLEVLIDFWKGVSKSFFHGNIMLPDQNKLEVLSHKITYSMLCNNKAERKSLHEINDYMRSMNYEAGRAQRPLIEMMPAFY